MTTRAYRVINFLIDRTTSGLFYAYMLWLCATPMNIGMYERTFGHHYFLALWFLMTSFVTVCTLTRFGLDELFRNL